MQIKPLGIPTRPVKGQMVCVVPQPGPHAAGPLIRHVVRTPEVYIIPRSDGRLLLGRPLRKPVLTSMWMPILQRLYRAAVEVVPEIGQMRIHDAWAGLRPGSPDGLPILGATSLSGYYAATGHYRDGIMLAPATAEAMTQLLKGRPPDFDMTPFSPLRFS